MGIPIKLKYQNETRRVSVNPGVSSEGEHGRLSMDLLTTKALELFPSIPPSSTITYVDEDGDVITVDSDDEMDEAVRILDSKLCFTIGPVKSSSVNQPAIQPTPATASATASATADAYATNKIDADELKRGIPNISLEACFQPFIGLGHPRGRGHGKPHKTPSPWPRHVHQDPHATQVHSQQRESREGRRRHYKRAGGGRGCRGLHQLAHALIGKPLPRCRGRPSQGGFPRDSPTDISSSHLCASSASTNDIQHDAPETSEDLDEQILNEMLVESMFDRPEKDITRQKDPSLQAGDENVEEVQISAISSTINDSASAGKENPASIHVSPATDYERLVIPSGERNRPMARYVRDVTVPDGSKLPAASGGTQFVKTWRIRNDGDIAWPLGSTPLSAVETCWST